MTDLSKSLTQIVANLMEIISSTRQTTLEPEEPRIKKTPDMTYHDYLRKNLAGKEPLQVNSKKMTYRLQEDMELLLQLTEQKQISTKTFQNIANKKRINRTFESLRSRYYDYLTKIEQKDMKKIVSWIQKQGIQGYLVFEGDNMTITKNEPRQGQKQQKQQKDNEKKRQRPTSLDKEAKKIQKTGKILPKGVLNNGKELNEVLKIYSKMVNIPVKILVQRLDQVSGDLLQLDTYIQTKDARLLWTPQEDQILVKGGAQLQILRRYRGNAVETRKKYLGL